MYTFFYFALFLGADCTVKVFSVGDFGKGVLYNLTNGHNRGISDIAWSPDGKYLASASDDTTIAIWSLPDDPNSIIEPCRKLTGHASYVYCVGFGANGSILASGGFDDCLRLWDTRKGVVFKEIAAHGDPITSVDFSQDGTTLLTGSFDGLMRLWDTESGRCLKTIVDNDNPPVSSAAFVANSKYILTATLDNHLRLWSPITAKCIRTFTAPGYAAQKYSCAARVLIHQESQTVLLLAASEDGAIYYWNLATREYLGKHQVLMDNSPLLSLAISPDQKLIACAGLEPHNEIHILSIMQLQ